MVTMATSGGVGFFFFCMVNITEQQAIVRLDQQMACDHNAKQRSTGRYKQKRRGKQITITLRKFNNIISDSQRGFVAKSIRSTTEVNSAYALCNIL